MVICFRYFGLRALISSKLKSSGGCTIFEVIPAPVGGAAATTAGLLRSAACVDAAADVEALLVVGGALIVALL